MIEKIRSADAVIFMDAMQFRRHAFVNRNRWSDGSWMTVPVNEHDTYAPINKVRIADGTWRARKKIAKSITLRLGEEKAAPYVRELMRPFRLLVGLNFRLLCLLLADLEVTTEQFLQSHLDAGHAVPIWSEDEDELLPARERLAMMVEEIGGSVWLSGPTGKRYLDEAPFRERGIEVRYTEGMGLNPSAIELLAG